MNILCVIPSRIASTRLPRKPLLPIQGKPMVQWVYESAKKCSAITEVVVATDSEEIAQVIQGVGGEVVMTDPEIPTGSDRVAAVARKYENMDVIINLQGDEPFIQPLMLKQLLQPYLCSELPEMTTLARGLDLESNYHRPETVKVLVDSNNYAIYFSRSAVPYFREKVQVPVYHHIGLYAFRRNFLLHLTSLPQTQLEKAEGLEQLRAIENGYKIKVCFTDFSTFEVNNQEELEYAQRYASQLQM